MAVVPHDYQYKDDFVDDFDDAKCGTCRKKLNTIEQYVQGFCSKRCREIALEKRVARHDD